MSREIRLRATSYCSRSRFLYSAGTSYVFDREECLQYASQTSEA